MKIQKTVCGFLGGVLLGVALALTFGASGQNSPAPTKPDWEHVRLSSLPAGGIALFDGATGKLYLYDVNAQNCYAIRELTTLGEPMRRLRN